MLSMDPEFFSRLAKLQAPKCTLALNFGRVSPSYCPGPGVAVFRFRFYAWFSSCLRQIFGSDAPTVGYQPIKSWGYRRVAYSCTVTSLTSLLARI
jgi:hypothetical protein